MRVIFEQDKNTLIKQTTQVLENLFTENKDKHILFLTSGGSSFDLLAQLTCSNKGYKISIGVLDERFNASSAINNFAQLAATEFFRKSSNLFEEVLDTRFIDGEILEMFTNRYETLLRNWKAKFPEGIIIATVGMGPDGHVSGIMPFPENEPMFHSLFVETPHWVIGYDAGGKNPYPQRATTTIPFLKNEIDFAVACITGDGKKAALKRVMAASGKLNETPARVLLEMKNVTVCTDINTED
ncbi:MAG: 6-phosphogluconolactonase [Candidatus Levyibacteriota bacterium]